MWPLFIIYILLIVQLHRYYKLKQKQLDDTIYEQKKEIEKLKLHMINREVITYEQNELFLERAYETDLIKKLGIKNKVIQDS